MEAFTTNLESRYFWIVLTFVGDSTITNDFPTRASLCVFTATARHAVQPPPEPAADVPAHPCGRDATWATPGGDGPSLARPRHLAAQGEPDPFVVGRRHVRRRHRAVDDACSLAPHRRHLADDI
jgi:hypothetical protein